MPSETYPNRVSVEEFAAQCRDAMVPVSSKFSYFQASPLGEEEVREYVEEPIAALPPGLIATLPDVCIALVPYLARLNGGNAGGAGGLSVSFEKPAENQQLAASNSISGGAVTLFFAIKDRPVADYHYHLYREIAALSADRASEECQNRFRGLLREELRSRVHGEVDQDGWHLKQSLMHRQPKLHRESKAFLDYAKQSFVDTLTLYLHGICCDIDVEPGPRQLPSRCLRKRLSLLEEVYAPPEGYAVFPEDLNQAATSPSRASSAE